MNGVRSYRAFSLLPVIFKVFEMLLSDGLSDVLESGAFPCSQPNTKNPKRSVYIDENCGF